MAVLTIRKWRRGRFFHTDPRDLVDSDADEVQQLRLAREEVKAAMNQAKKAAPVFAGNVALVRMNSPCQVHPLIAQIWRSRLPRYIVIAANEGYLSNRVNFSALSANVSVLEFCATLTWAKAKATTDTVTIKHLAEVCRSTVGTSC